MEEASKSSKPSFNLGRYASRQWWPAAVVTAAIFGIGGFAAGVHYQKGHDVAPASAPTNQMSFNGADGPGMGMRGGVFGSVTAISDSSITVSEQRSGSSQTLTITSSTTFSKDGATAGISDVSSGDTVLVRTSTSNSSEASQIIINPSLPSGGPGGSMESGNNATGTTQTN